MGKIVENYGELVFNRKEMKKRLSATVFEKYMNTIQEGEALDQSIAEDIARAMKAWAIEKGATHFTHWFQPQRNGTAEKHDAFLDYNKKGEIIEKFSTQQLIQSEPDASSFPSGGIRSTFEARGYTAWDPSSPAFLRESPHGNSLVIPSIYLSWTGESLGMKTPLLRSIDVLNKYVIKLQRLLGNRLAKRITVFSGMEQEYFLIPLSLAEARPDLMICGRTVFGAPPAKGQTMDDHYFGSITPRVMEFMGALEMELYRFGIPAKTKHNEVAPNQFELAPLYEDVNLAIDHNLLTMDIMKRVAADHDFALLCHEKPFARLNGSGKHMNWSIGDNTGTNYLEPSKSPLKNISFLMTLGAVLLGVKDYSGLLRGSIADAGNEHRLGSHEAPPAILSVYLGDYLAAILDDIEGLKKLSEKKINEINLGLNNMPKVAKDISDRNRTSPIAFTGNKFEFRAVGSSANGSRSAKAMNMICAYGYKTIIERLEKMKGKDVKANCILLLKDILKETKAVRFEGNGYAGDWVNVAKKRGLYIADNTADALKYFQSKESVELFETLGVLTKREVESRAEIKLENYANTKSIELKVALDMVKTYILPAMTKQMIQLGEALSSCKLAGVNSKTLIDDIKLIEKLYTSIKDQSATLAIQLEKMDANEDAYKRAHALATKGTSLYNSLRNAVDTAEENVDVEYWSLPRYDELLLGIS
ncbi:glutamine synthetase type III [Candidatus Marinamargulisbacteria bacterium SCGC AAA071-K20]|nr:glutamine synthetase type III [Candidatus Marinamargulisbacteria bacterium SCGC AAA071-K20]